MLLIPFRFNLISHLYFFSLFRPGTTSFSYLYCFYIHCETILRSSIYLMLSLFSWLCSRLVIALSMNAPSSKLCLPAIFFHMKVLSPNFERREMPREKLGRKATLNCSDLLSLFLENWNVLSAKFVYINIFFFRAGVFFLQRSCKVFVREKELSERYAICIFLCMYAQIRRDARSGYSRFILQRVYVRYLLGTISLNCFYN